MSLMLRLIGNELGKISRQWRIVIAIGFLTLIAAAIGLGGKHEQIVGINAATMTYRFSSGVVAAVLIPFTICLIAGDIVSGELSGGTIKLLLTRPVSRWKIWLSKFIAAALASWAVMLYFIVLVYLVLGLTIGFGHWNDPILALGGEKYNTAWAATWRVVAVEAFAMLSLVGLVLLLSTLVNTGVAGIGISFGAIILGFIVSAQASSHDWLRYLIFPHLQAADHLTGDFSLSNCTLRFSLGVLGAWLAVSIALALWRFQRRDILA